MRLDRRDETDTTDGDRLIDLFTYYCVDGVVRTRCERHIARAGPYKIFGREPYHVRRGVSWRRCVECDYEYEQQKQKERERDRE